ncbi:Mut7-C RNAse domain-containing protein [Fervidobacterium sp.]
MYDSINEKLEKFLCDLTVVKLGKKLRILGYDVEIIKSVNPSDIENKIAADNRKLITKSHKLAKKYNGILIVSNKIIEQLQEILPILTNRAKKGSARCAECNEPLVEYSTENVTGKVPIYVFESIENFRYCPKCGKIYWKGTHVIFFERWNNVERTLKSRQGEVKQ